MATSSPAPVADRDVHLDNVRAVLVALVVVGHTLPLLADPWARQARDWIYLFHMPAFVLVSGYLSRSFAARPDQNRRLVTDLLVPYVVFGAILTAEEASLDGTWSLGLVVPRFALWYLLALLVWRLLTPVLRVVRHVLAWSVAAAVLAPLDHALGAELSLGRIVGFLPFYVLGLCLRPEHVQLLRRRSAAVLGAVALAAALGVVAFVLPRFSPEWTYARTAYVDFTDSGWRAVAIRLGFLVVAAVLSAAVLAVVPSGRRWWSFVGRNTLTVYLLHAVIVFPLLDHRGRWSGLAGVAAVAVALLATVVLGSPPVERATRWLVRPGIARRLVLPSHPDERPADRQGSIEPLSDRRTA